MAEAEAVTGESTENQEIAARAFGEVVLKMDSIEVGFGGVKAIDNVSFEVRKGEILAIIGPNGAGKSSMLNCINGFYKPRSGSITFKGKTMPSMDPHYAASNGIARTFQNIALFRGMSTLDNLMTGRVLKMKRGFFWQALYAGPAQKEELENRAFVEKVIDFLGIQPFGARRSAACPTVCRSGSNWAERWRWSPISSCLTSRWPE